MTSVSSAFKVQKFQFKIKTNLNTEARINLKLQLRSQLRQFHYKIYTSQDTSRPSTLKKAIFTFSRSEVSVSPVSTAELSLDVQQNKLFLHFDKRDHKFAHEPAMQTDKSIKHNQSTESVVRTIPTGSIYHISEPIMSENSPKTLSFRLFGDVFHSALREHCATVRHTARFWRLFHSFPCNSFVHFFPFFLFYFLSF